MSSTTPSAPALAELHNIHLDVSRAQALGQQLYLAIRDKILQGQLEPKTRLPASRQLAKQLAVGRNTVISAYEQLASEGYLDNKPGSGSYVAQTLPEHWQAKAERARDLSSSVQVHRELPRPNDSFAVGIPDLSAFPHKVWQRLSQQLSMSNTLMAYGETAGYWPLRQAIAHYLKQSRAVHCRPEQILITAGAQQALDLCSRLLLNEGDKAAIEEPGYRGMRKALLHLQEKINIDISPCPVDEQGLCLKTLKAFDPAPKLSYVTPANQYPMGARLSLERKMELLNWAKENNSWIIEDDYDSEYHYHRRPLASLQGLDQGERVIYLGSFSKTLFPALRLGYLVLPESLFDKFCHAKIDSTGETPLFSQAITAAFIKEGHFNRHLRRMRLRYADKLETLHKAAPCLAHWGFFHQRNAGMHVVFEFHQALDDQHIASHLSTCGIHCSPLSDYFLNQPKRGLVLGFANTAAEAMKEKLLAIDTALAELYKNGAAK